MIDEQSSNLIVGLEALPFDTTDPIKATIIPIFSSYAFWSQNVWDGDEDWVSEDYDPVSHMNGSGNAVGADGGGDHLHLATELVFIDKRVNSADKVTAAPGDTLRFSIDVELAGASAVPVDDIQVVDVLPAELLFVPGSDSSSLGASAVESPAGTLTWDFGSVQPGTTITISYEATLALDAAPNSVFNNVAKVTGDPTRLTQLATASPTNAAAATVLTSGGTTIFRIRKASATPMVSIDGGIQYDLVYENAGATALSEVDAIDVFPFNGDGLGSGAGTDRVGGFGPSSFNGTLSLSDVVTVHGERILLTSAPPASISLDPGDATNALPGGSTVWCEELDSTPSIPNLGDAGCPASRAAATGLRFLLPSAQSLAAGESRTLQLQFTTAGNRAGDIYTNNFGARTASLVFEAVSNDTSAQIVSPGIRGTVWLDADGDGVVDADELRMQDISVRLSGTSGAATPIDIVLQTDADGSYLFDGANVPSDRRGQLHGHGQRPPRGTGADLRSRRHRYCRRGGAFAGAVGVRERREFRLPFLESLHDSDPSSTRVGRPGDDSPDGGLAAPTTKGVCEVVTPGRREGGLARPPLFSWSEALPR